MDTAEIQIDVIVSRHQPAVEFIANVIGGTVVSPRLVSIESENIIRDIGVLDSATADDVRGKVVAGNLPLHLAAEAETVYAIEFDGAPPRGQEFGLAEMREAGARLVPYRVERVQ